MKLEYDIIDVNADNLNDYPQVVCFTNAKHPYHQIKIDWIREQFEKGLKIKLLFLAGVRRPVGFIEYIPGENCWRAVNATGYMFIHCLWTNGKKYQHQGLGSILIKAAEEDAVDLKGVAVITSDKAFMTNKNIFLKNRYEKVEEYGKEQLLVKQFGPGKLPKLLDYRSKLKEIQDLTIIYSDQCPWVSRFIKDMQPVLKERKLNVELIKLKTAEEAQEAPSLYSVFNLIYKGRILADRYISITRFKNILNKEVKL